MRFPKLASAWATVTTDQLPRCIPIVAQACKYTCIGMTFVAAKILVVVLLVISWYLQKAMPIQQWKFLVGEFAVAMVAVFMTQGAVVAAQAAADMLLVSVLWLFVICFVGTIMYLLNLSPNDREIFKLIRAQWVYFIWALFLAWFACRTSDGWDGRVSQHAWRCFRKLISKAMAIARKPISETIAKPEDSIVCQSTPMRDEQPEKNRSVPISKEPVASAEPPEAGERSAIHDLEGMSGLLQEREKIQAEGASLCAEKQQPQAEIVSLRADTDVNKIALGSENSHPPPNNLVAADTTIPVAREKANLASLAPGRSMIILDRYTFEARMLQIQNDLAAAYRALDKNSITIGEIDLLEEINRLKDCIATLGNAEIGSVKEHIELGKQTDNLRASNFELENANTTFIVEKAELSKQIDNLKASISGLQEMNDKMYGDNTNLWERIEEYKRNSEKLLNQYKSYAVVGQSQARNRLLLSHRMTGALFLDLFSLGKRLWVFLRISYPQQRPMVWGHDPLPNDRRSITVWPSVADKAMPPKTYEYDKVFASGEEPTEIARTLWVFFFAVIQGRDICIIADGSSGSGKSYTLYTQAQSLIHRAADAYFGLEVASLIESITFSAVYTRGKSKKTWFDVVGQLPGGVTRSKQLRGKITFSIKSVKGFKALVDELNAQRDTRSTVKVYGQDAASLSIVDLAGNERQEDDANNDQELERRDIVNDRLVFQRVLLEHIEKMKNPKNIQTIKFNDCMLTECLESSFGTTRSGLNPVLAVLAHVSLENDLKKHSLFTLKQTSKLRQGRQWKESKESLETLKSRKITPDMFFSRLDRSVEAYPADVERRTDFPEYFYPNSMSDDMDSQASSLGVSTAVLGSRGEGEVEGGYPTILQRFETLDRNNRSNKTINSAGSRHLLQEEPLV